MRAIVAGMVINYLKNMFQTLADTVAVEAAIEQPPGDPQWGLGGWDDPANRGSNHNSAPYVEPLPVVTLPELVADESERGCDCCCYDCCGHYGDPS